MSDRKFWIEHFDRADPTTQRRFVTLGPAEAAEILEQRGLPQAPGETRESAENRVFVFGDVVLKVFRPGRWSHAALVEEVVFLEDLRAAGVAAVRPIGGVQTWRGLHHLAYERVEGDDDRAVFSLEQMRQFVDLVAAFHDVGARRDAPHRPRLLPRAKAEGLLERVCGAGFLPPGLVTRYEAAVRGLAERLERLLDGVPQQRIHADIGSWNVLWRPAGPLLMDLDDFEVGPVALDLRLMSAPWRLDSLPEALDRKERRARQHRLVLARYRERRAFPEAWEALLRPTGILRGVMFDAWFCANWSEPGFRAHYPDDDIEGEAYWLRAVEAMEDWLRG